MLKFFARIRRRLLGQGNLRKYLVYAIGEILLVMIGILLALQVNNWNEKKKITQLEKEYLERLELDLVQDTLYFSRRLKESQEVVENHYKLIHQMYYEQINKQEVYNLLGLVIWNSEHFVFQNSTFSELKNTGLINILSNPELKKDIVSLYYDYDVIGTHVKEINEFSINLYSDIVVNHVKYREVNKYIWDQEKMFSETEWQFLNKPFSEDFRKLETTAGYYSYKHILFIRYFKDLKSKAIILIGRIQSELKN